MPPKQLNTFGQDITQFGGSPVPLSQPVVPGEPAVLSSVSGENSFKTNVQPKIDAANANVADGTTLKQDIEKAANQGKAGYDIFGNKVDILPADVQSEIDANKTDEQKAYEARLANYDTQERNARDTFASLSLAATSSAKAAINSLTSQWAERRRMLEQSNKANEANWTQQFIRFGQAEYSPGMTSDMITGKEQEGIAKIKSADDEYNAKVAEINTALDNKQYTLAATLTSDLGTIEEKALTLMQTNAKEAKAVNDKIRERTIQSSRDNAIAGLVAQGVTDPTEIAQLLEEAAKASGTTGDFTAEEIDKALKVFNPSNELAGLDTDLRTFKYLQENQPEMVKGLDFLGYKNAVYNATHKADKTGGEVSLPTSDKTKLLGAGFTQADISNIQHDVNAHGIDAVLAGLTDEKQKRALQDVYGVADNKQFLTEDYIKTLFGDSGIRQAIADQYKNDEDGLKKLAEDAGYRHLLTNWSSEKDAFLNSDAAKNQYVAGVMSTIEQYRAAGYNDKDILKMLQ